ncbi:MAG: hypothetical protein WCF57_07110 [Pyrinomonadaceae bacterium]
MNKDIPVESYYFDPRVFTNTSGFPDPGEIKIYDATLRDGEQSPGLAFTPAQKLEIAEALSDIGVHIIDLGFPFSSATEAESLKLIVEARKQGRIRSDLEFTVCCRADRRDIDATIKALAEIGAGPDEVTFTILTSASDIHLKHKLGPMLIKREGRDAAEAEKLPISFYRESNLRMIQEVVSYAKSQGVHHMELAAEDASRSHIDYLIRLVKIAVDAGVERYGFADTTGSLTPESTQFYLVQLRKSLGKLPILTHFHNDFDLATINTIIALSLGIPIFSCTVNGIGERAGNTSLHAVVVALKLLYDITIPNFKYEKLWELRQLVERISGLPLQAHEPVVGINTFAHESGIHVHGVMTHPRTYEPIPPELVGGERRFVFGKHGGTGLVRAFLEKQGVEFENEEGEVTDILVQQVLAGIKELREQRAEEGVTYRIVDDYYKSLAQLEITDKEVLAIARAHVLLVITQTLEQAV